VLLVRWRIYLAIDPLAQARPMEGDARSMHGGDDPGGAFVHAVDGSLQPAGDAHVRHDFRGLLQAAANAGTGRAGGDG